MCFNAGGHTPLILLKVPISVTLGIFDDIFLVDPSTRDQNVMRGTITCATDECGIICFLNQVSLTVFSSSFLSYLQISDFICILSVHFSCKCQSLDYISWYSSFSSILNVHRLSSEMVHHPDSSFMHQFSLEFVIRQGLDRKAIRVSSWNLPEEGLGVKDNPVKVTILCLPPTAFLFVIFLFKPVK